MTHPGSGKVPVAACPVHPAQVGADHPVRAAGLGAGGPSAGAGDGVGAFADDRGGDDPVPGGAGSAGWALASDQ